MGMSFGSPCLTRTFLLSLESGHLCIDFASFCHLQELFLICLTKTSNEIIAELECLALLKTLYDRDLFTRHDAANIVTNTQQKRCYKSCWYLGLRPRVVRERIEQSLPVPRI